MKNKFFVCLCILLFGGVGIYFTFFAGNTSKYDSQTKAYRIYENESSDSDGGYTYQPIYYFEVDGKEYECKSKRGSSSSPSEDKNIVYYDSTNPKKCMTQYDQSTGKIAGIICLIAAIVIIVFALKKPSKQTNEQANYMEIDPEKQRKIEENVQKVADIAEKVELIYKRVILGIIIVILFVFILLDTIIFKQTLQAKDYIDTTATYVNKKEVKEDSSFDDCIYTFKDNQGNSKEIIVSVAKDKQPDSEIKIKYNESNPQDYYEEGSTFDKSGIIWYIVKVVALIILIILFLNKKLLSKIRISASHGNRD